MVKIIAAKVAMDSRRATPPKAIKKNIELQRTTVGGVYLEMFRYIPVKWYSDSPRATMIQATGIFPSTRRICLAVILSSVMNTTINKLTTTVGRRINRRKTTLNTRYPGPVSSEVKEKFDLFTLVRLSILACTQ